MDFLSLFIAVLPIILIGLFIYKHDNVKESSKLLFKLFICGVSSCFPAIILELVLGSFFPNSTDVMNLVQVFLYSFIVIALSEELCKWFFVYKVSYNHDEFDSLYDMIVYASFVALGFACFENVLYVLSNGIVTGVFRAISAVPGHVCDGILMGTYLSFAKVSEIKNNIAESKKYKFYSLLFPIIIHGIYDFCLFSENIFFILFFLIYLIALFILCFKKVKDISKNNIKFLYKDKYCTNCGLAVTSNFCTRCGKENK